MSADDSTVEAPEPPGPPSQALAIRLYIASAVLLAAGFSMLVLTAMVDLTSAQLISFCGAFCLALGGILLASAAGYHCMVKKRHRQVVNDPTAPGNADPTPAGIIHLAFE